MIREMCEFVERILAIVHWQPTGWSLGKMKDSAKGKPAVTDPPAEFANNIQCYSRPSLRPSLQRQPRACSTANCVAMAHPGMAARIGAKECQ